MTLFNASGTVSGTSSASSAGVVLTFVSTVLQGTGDLGAALGVVRISSARFDGAGSLDWDYRVEASGVVSGTSAASGAALIAKSAFGTFQGASAFLYAVPLIVFGASSMSATVVVDRHLPPIRAITMGPKTFSWLHLLQRGDLSVFICDSTGPVVPFSIRYRLIQVRLNGSRQPMGPRERVPVAGVAGEFYATGRAGENGQPGQWIVEWTFQRSSSSELQVVEFPFMVLDAVLAGVPGDVTCRKTKYGWN